MKKLIWIVVLAVMVLSGKVYADKATSYTTVIFTITKTPNVVSNIVGEITYRPWTIKIRGKACTADGGIRKITITDTVGDLSETRLTGTQLYSYILHDTEKQLLATFYTQALDEDITQ